MNLIDLSHKLVEGMPFWPTHALYKRHILETFPEAVAEHAELGLDEHSGTHVDAPGHFIKGAKTVEEVELARFIGTGRVFDARQVGPLGMVDQKMIQTWEEQNGPIKAGDIVLFFFGWSLKWGDNSAIPQFMEQWPGLDETASQHLVRRKVASVGTDALSIDVAISKTYPAHYTLLSAGIPIFENVNHLDRVISERFTFVGWPLAVRHGSGSPVRAVALLSE